MKLTDFIAEIKRDGKIQAEEISNILAESIEEEKDSDEIFKCLYTKAYGSHLNKSLAECWVKRMAVTDGSERSTGEKWTLEQTSEIGQKLNIDWTKINKLEWYAAMNAAYSDLYSVAKEFELENEPLFFAHYAKAFWIDDNDVHDKTLLNYYFDFVA